MPTQWQVSRAAVSSVHSCCKEIRGKNAEIARLRASGVKDGRGNGCDARVVVVETVWDPHEPLQKFKKNADPTENRVLLGIYVLGPGAVLTFTYVTTPT